MEKKCNATNAIDDMSGRPVNHFCHPRTCKRERRVSLSWVRALVPVRVRACPWLITIYIAQVYYSRPFIISISHAGQYSPTVSHSFRFFENPKRVGSRLGGPRPCLCAFIDSYSYSSAVARSNLKITQTGTFVPGRPPNYSTSKLQVEALSITHTVPLQLWSTCITITKPAQGIRN